MAYREFTWNINANADKTTNFITQTLGFGNGYEQKISYGINNTRLLWDCSVTDKQTTIDSVHQFFVDHKGVIPFYVTIGGRKNLYVTEGDPTTHHVGYDVWSISFKLKQVFLP